MGQAWSPTWMPFSMRVGLTPPRVCVTNTETVRNVAKKYMSIETETDLFLSFDHLPCQNITNAFNTLQSKHRTAFFGN